jgi:hypothetical protein
MGSVALAAIFGCQMHFLFLSRSIDWAHLFVALLETQLVSRGFEQLCSLASMRPVTGQAFTFGNRFMHVFPGQYRFFIMAIIAQLACGSFDLGRFF